MSDEKDIKEKLELLKHHMYEELNLLKAKIHDDDIQGERLSFIDASSSGKKGCEHLGRYKLTKHKRALKRTQKSGVGRRHIAR